MSRKLDVKVLVARRLAAQGIARGLIEVYRANIAALEEFVTELDDIAMEGSYAVEKLQAATDAGQGLIPAFAALQTHPTLMPGKGGYDEAVFALRAARDARGAA